MTFEPLDQSRESDGRGHLDEKMHVAGITSTSITSPPHSATTDPIISLSRAATGPANTRRRYFGHQMRWYFAEYTVLFDDR